MASANFSPIYNEKVIYFPFLIPQDQYKTTVKDLLCSFLDTRSLFIFLYNMFLFLSIS